MTSLLSRITLALAGSGVLFLSLLHATDQCPEGWRKDSGVVIVRFAACWWWVALATAIVFAIDTEKHEEWSVANVAIGASEATAVVSLVGVAFEIVFCDLQTSRVVMELLEICFLLTLIVTPMALVWRAWCGE